MIEDLTDLEPGTVIGGDVAVLGAGFAGIDLALRLARAGVRVVLLESGRERFDPRIQALTREVSVGRPLRTPDPSGPFTPYLPPVFRGESRVRQLGGTSNIWTGKWRAFDELDLADRPWVPHSGWPLGHAELARWYAEVADAYGLGDRAALEADPAVVAARRALVADGLTLSFHRWQRDPSRPGVDHRDELAATENLRVVLGATATELLLGGPDDDRVRAATVRSLDGGEARVEAGTFVVAMGGLETPRLLLSSDRHRPGGLGNEHDLVGRFHMDHPKTKRARLVPGPRFDLVAPWTPTRPRPRWHASIELSDDVQRETGVLDHAVYLSPVYDYLVDYPAVEATALRDALRGRRVREAAVAAGRLLRRPGAVRKVAARTRHRDLGGRVAHHTASMYVEQAPNPDSRLSLADERDELGVRRLRVDWQLTDQDHRAFGTLLTELSTRLERAGLGRLEVDEEARTLDGWVDAAHHMGSTRMAVEPSAGVVDPDLRVFGTDNLYVASSSVFPTGHSAAPTMTILALTARLADHLLDARGGHAR